MPRRERRGRRASGREKMKLRRSTRGNKNGATNGGGTDCRMRKERKGRHESGPDVKLASRARGLRRLRRLRERQARQQSRQQAQRCPRSPYLCTSSLVCLPLQRPSTNTFLFFCSQLSIPFQNRQQALIAEQSLSPDPVLKPDQSRIEYSVSDGDANGDSSLLRIDVHGMDDRIVRVTANNLLESLKTVIECLEEFEVC